MAKQVTDTTYPAEFGLRIATRPVVEMPLSQPPAVDPKLKRSAFAPGYKVMTFDPSPDGSLSLRLLANTTSRIAQI